MHTYIYTYIILEFRHQSPYQEIGTNHFALPKFKHNIMCAACIQDSDKIYQKSIKISIFINLKIYWVNLIHLLFFRFVAPSD